MVGLIAGGVCARGTEVAALIEQVRGGCRAAERELAVLLHRETRRAARSLTRSRGRRAAELGADAEPTVWQNVVGHFDPAAGRSLRRFVYEAVRRVAVDSFRREHAKRRGGDAIIVAFESGTVAGSFPDPEAQAIARDTLERALASLPEPHRSIVIRILGGEPQNAIAASLGRHPSQVTRMMQSVVVTLAGGTLP